MSQTPFERFKAAAKAKLGGLFMEGWFDSIQESGSVPSTNYELNALSAFLEKLPDPGTDDSKDTFYDIRAVWDSDRMEKNPDPFCADRWNIFIRTERRKPLETRVWATDDGVLHYRTTIKTVHKGMGAPEYVVDALFMDGFDDFMRAK